MCAEVISNAQHHRAQGHATDIYALLSSRDTKYPIISTVQCAQRYIDILLLRLNIAN